MTASIPSLLQPLKDRLAAATPGPWEASPYVVYSEQDDSERVRVKSPHDGPDYNTAEMVLPKDATFIAAAPTDQAKLIAAIEAVEKEVAWGEQQFTTSNSQDVAMRAAAYKIRAALTQALGGDTA